MGGEAMDIHTAVQEVLKNAMVVDGLVRGLREAVKALDKRKAHLCILAANCDEPSYVKLVEALCVEHNIPMFKVCGWWRRWRGVAMAVVLVSWFSGVRV